MLLHIHETGARSSPVPTGSEIPDEYQRHGKVFSEEESHRFPPSRPWDHAIELKEGAPEAINCKTIPTTMEEDEMLKRFIKEQLEKGYIQKSKSPYASAFFFIKKKDGKLCLIQDYRKLNQYTVRNKYPLPLIPELISQVKDTNIFSKFDIRWGYNNIRIKDGDQQKAAFKTCYARTGHSSRREVSWSGVGTGLSALATCDADMW